MYGAWISKKGFQNQFRKSVWHSKAQYLHDARRVRSHGPVVGGSGAVVAVAVPVPTAAATAEPLPAPQQRAVRRPHLGKRVAIESHVVGPCGAYPPNIPRLVAQCMSHLPTLRIPVPRSLLCASYVCSACASVVCQTALALRRSIKDTTRTTSVHRS